MGERKVLNKYYPPDFDHAKIPRKNQPKNQQIGVRMMLPMTICCKSCKNYIYKGTKFNSRKETVVGETYLGIQVFRFYFKCTRCSAELTMKTDSQNSDYTSEFGAKRNFEPWCDEDEEADGERRKREGEEMGDAMKSLENRTLECKREMDVLATLDELKSMRSRQGGVSSEELLEALRRSGVEKMEKALRAEDEALVKSIYRGTKTVIRRIDDEDVDEDEDLNLAAGNDQEFINNNSIKRRKVDLDLEKPTDSLTIKSVFDVPKGKIAAASKNPKFLFKSTSVTVKVVKKPSPMHVHVPVSLPREDSSPNSNVIEQNTVLQYIGQNYDSNED